MRPLPLILTLLTLGPAVPHAVAQRQVEQLDRGLVVIPSADGAVFASWRLLASDPEETGFNLYRVRDGKPEKVNPRPLTGSTSLTDATPGTGYFIRPVGKDGEGPACPPVEPLVHPYIEFPIEPIDGYRPGDASAADLDGDGRYEIILHQVSKGRDNSFTGITGTPVIDAYRLDGTRLWRIDLGINIREGEHYTQFIVFDLDGDGRAELACKTADGTKDGTGKTIGDGSKDWRNKETDSRRYGRVLSGPEFLTIFDGATGAAIDTVDYIPGRDPIDGWGGVGGNGGTDDYGNRCDRFLACVAMLDGRRPSLVMCRGVYGRSVLAAWDLKNGKLVSRWVFDSGISHPPFKDASPYSGMGGHSLTVADVDADGRDEIVYQAMTVDDDGKGLYSTGRRHGDAIHVGDFDPARKGLETFLTTENEEQTAELRTPGAGLHDARNGSLLWSRNPGEDISGGVVADIDPRHPGAEVWWDGGKLHDIRGGAIGAAPHIVDWVVWWDGDLLREIYGGFSVFKWDWNQAKLRKIAALDPPAFRGGWNRHAGMRPNLAADLLGDWREELLVPSPDGRAMRLYVSAVPTSHRFRTLMQDPQYRLAVASQNVAYNKPPHPGYFLGHGMRSE